MKKSNIIKYIIIPVIVLSVFALADLPKSHAKYFKEDNFSYNTEIKSLNNTTNNMTINFDNYNSTYQKAIYNISFQRNNIMYESDENSNLSDKLDTYKITMENNNNNCMFTYIDSAGTDSIEDNYIASIFETLNTNDTVNFKVKCDVIDNEEIPNTTEKLTGVTFKVEETIKNYNLQNNESFTYITKQDTTTLDEYYIGDRTPPKEAKNLYEGALSTIKNQYKNNVSEETYNNLIKYFNSAFTNEPTNEIITDTTLTKDENFASKISILKGFSYNENNKTYTFDNNFIGYAYTYVLQNDNTHQYQFAFSITDSEEAINSQRMEIFKDYLQTYGSETLKQNDNIQAIIKYIEGYSNKINAAFDDNIPEITKNVIEDVTILSLSDSIINEIKDSSVKTEVTKTISNSNQTIEKIWEDDFMNVVNSNQITIADGTLVDKIESLGPNGTASLSNSIAKNATKSLGDPLEIFSDFYTINGNNKKAIINIYSGTTSSLDTYISIFDIAKGKEVTLAFPKNGTYNLDKIQTINQISTTVNSGNTAFNITSLGEPYSTFVEGSYKHQMYNVNGIKYNCYTLTDTTENQNLANYGIEYITYIIN